MISNDESSRGGSQLEWVFSPFRTRPLLRDKQAAFNMNPSDDSKPWHAQLHFHDPCYIFSPDVCVRYARCTTERVRLSGENMGVRDSSPARVNQAYKDTESEKLQDSRHCCLEIIPFALCLTISIQRIIWSQSSGRRKEKDVKTRGSAILTDWDSSQ